MYEDNRRGGNAVLFHSLLARIDEIVSSLSGEAALHSICKLLRDEVPHYNWVGFYIVSSGNELILGPFVGEPTEHTKIHFGEGICGQAAERMEAFVVQDVSNEKNYLSCSVDVKSEIVVPVFKEGKLVGELDIDSHSLSPFSSDDVEFLEQVCEKASVFFGGDGNGMTIREFRMADYEDMISLWEDAGLPYKPLGRDSRESIERQMNLECSIYLVAEVDGRLVGSILATHDGRKGWINRIAVLPPYRKRGIAAGLVEEAERRISGLGIDITACLVEDWNASSMEVFEKLGYTKHPDIIYFTKRKNSDV